MKRWLALGLCALLMFAPIGPAARAMEYVDYDWELSADEKVMRDAGFIEVHQANGLIWVKLMYGTTDNLAGYDLYGDLKRAYLHPSAALALGRAQRLLYAQDSTLALCVKDAARPLRVQQALWDALPDPSLRGYLANPKTGSLHNYGIAVDVTLVNARTGEELDMGCPVDTLEAISQPRYEQKFLKEGKLTQQQLDNRLLLRSVMTQAGFQTIPNEWWHFQTMNRAQAKQASTLIP